MRFHFRYIAYFYTMCNTPAREYDLALVTHANTVSEVKPLQGNLRIPGIYMIYKDFYFFFFFFYLHITFVKTFVRTAHYHEFMSDHYLKYQTRTTHTKATGKIPNAPNLRIPTG